MPYYMTFFLDHASGLTFAEIEEALWAEDQAYRIEVLDRLPMDSFEAADLRYGDDEYARLEINRVGDPLFQGEIQDHLEKVEYGGRGQTSQVATTLRHANTILRVQVCWKQRDRDLTLDRLQPLWDWLFAFRSGVLHADGEGFYDADGIIVEDG
jgi:hypothetical protein